MAMTAWAAKLLSKLDLLVGEWSDLLPVNADDSDELFFLKHRDEEQRPCAGHVGKRDQRWIPFDIGLLFADVGDVLQPLGCDHTTERIVRTGSKYRLALPQLRPFRPGTKQNRNPQHLSVVQRKISEAGFADLGRVRQDGPEHWLQIARRA